MITVVPIVVLTPVSVSSITIVDFFSVGPTVVFCTLRARLRAEGNVTVLR
jgi:hypothetical protein